MLTLRKIEPQDLPYLYQWENDAMAWADGTNHNPLSQQDLREYIQSTTGDIYKDGQLRLVILVDSASIGCIDLYDFDPRNLRAAVGVYIAPDWREKGWGKQALQTLEQYAFNFLNLRTIYAYISEKNTPSSTIFLQQQFVPVGPLPGWTLQGNAFLYIKNNANRI